MAVLIRVDRNGTKYYEGMILCDRCGGAGGWDGWRATGCTCWKCGGTGKVPGKWVERTPEYEAKLAERRRAKAEALAAKYEEERKEREAAEEAERIAREAEEARIKAQKATSQYIGQIGEKVDTTATYDHSAWFEVRSFYGYGTETMYIHTFRANGNLLVWKTGKGLNLQKGDTVQIKGTIKDLSEYEDEKQTVLTRCKITK